MVKVRAFNGKTLLIDLECESHGRTLPLSKDEAERLAKDILERVREPEYPNIIGCMDGFK